MSSISRMRLLSQVPEPCKELGADQKQSFLQKEREKLTSKLLQEPLNFLHYLDRAIIHYNLAYPDLAAGDAYRALILQETYFDRDFSEFYPGLQTAEGKVVPWPEDDETIVEVRRATVKCLRYLVLALIDLGCLCDAHTYLLRLEGLDEGRIFLTEGERHELRDLIGRAEDLTDTGTIAQRDGDLSNGKIEPSRLRNSGFVRREVYRWNNHEPDRSSSDTIDALNELLKPVAPALEVRSVELPVLDDPSENGRLSAGIKPTSSTRDSRQHDPSANSIQLGLFAKTDLSAASRIHREPSVLTAVRPLHASLCHNCGVNIAEALSTCLEQPVCCPSCADGALFCSQACLEIARTQYHNVTCGIEDIEPLGRNESSQQPSEDLYFLLLVRAFAMSLSQNTHPLELREVKYLWGDFRHQPRSKQQAHRSLHFTFQHTIVLPFRLLSILSDVHPDMSPFSSRGLDWYDTWVVQTLYAKFRGVASARQSSWDGKPEVAAVHPLWCLANHSCAPNVEWDWGRERVLRVRDRPVLWGDRKGTSGGDWGGIAAGEEILSHYCDVELPVKERREYMLGSLGGECICERCIWESGQERC